MKFAYAAALCWLSWNVYACGADPKPSDASAVEFDLSTAEFNPPTCPAWAREDLPGWFKPLVGKNGLPVKWRPKGVLGSAVQGIDRYQANQFVCYRPETAEFLYRDYTPTVVNYQRGTLPEYERLAAKYTAGKKTDEEKAVALLLAMPEYFRHPTMPPLGPSVRADRNLDDEPLLATGSGFCNEQARVFIRLCQVCGIPARMAHLFGQNHTVAEFYAGGHWMLADASNFFVAAGPDGKLLSVVQCHDRAAGQKAYAQTKERRMRELLAMSDEQLGFKSPQQASRWRISTAAFSADTAAHEEWFFGLINYPLPKTDN